MPVESGMFLPLVQTECCVCHIDEYGPLKSLLVNQADLVQHIALHCMTVLVSRLHLRSGLDIPHQTTRTLQQFLKGQAGRMTAHDTLTLLACQLDIPLTASAAARDAHLERSAAKLRTCLSAKPADIVVLPELSSIDYSRDAFDRLDQISEPLDGNSFQTWAALALEFDTFIAYSFARREGEHCYICIAVVTPQGVLAGYYDKLHLCQYGASMEKEYFQSGDHLLTLQIKGFTLAPIICYDIRFPELARTLVLDHGVDVIMHCGAYFRDPSFPTWHAFATTRALENQCFVLSLNRAGQNYGNSLFCYPWMDENQGPQHFAEHAEDFRYIEVARHLLDEARGTYTFLQDKWVSYDLPVQSDHLPTH